LGLAVRAGVGLDYTGVSACGDGKVWGSRGGEDVQEAMFSMAETAEAMTARAVMAEEKCILKNGG
jgi:hypothetical protein